MKVVALRFVIACKNVFVFKAQFDLIPLREINMIAQQIQCCEQKGSNKIRQKKTFITHPGIEHRHEFCIGSHTRGKKDHSNQGKNRPQQSIDPRYKMQVIIEQDLFFGHRLINELFNVITEVDGDSDNSKEQRGEEKRTQEFADNIFIEREQERACVNDANIEIIEATAYLNTGMHPLRVQQPLD